MSKISKKTLVLTLALVAVIAVGAALALSLTSFDGNSALAPSDTAHAAISAASSFGKFANGSKYFYTDLNGVQQTITVSSTATHGTRTNPFVITTKEQWQLMINKVAEQGPNCGGVYNSNSTYYSLGADIDFGNNMLAPVGKGVAGFMGQFLGNKHTVKNAYLDFYNSGYGSEGYHCAGLFNCLRGGAGIFDLIIDSSIKIDATKMTSGNTGSTTGAMGNSREMLIGGCASWVSGPANLSNIISKVTITLNSTSATFQRVTTVGGIVGSNWSGTCGIYNCVSSARIECKGGATNPGIESNIRIGGIVGSMNDINSKLTINNCAVTGTTLIAHNGGVTMGGVLGCMINSASQTVSITNTVVNATLSLPDAAANYTTPDYGAIIGYASAGLATGSKISDIYITGGSPTNQIYSSVANNLTSGMAAYFSNIQTSAATSAGIVPSVLASKVTKKGSSSAAAAAANADADIKKVFSVASNGTVTSKLATNYITFVKGAGATGGPTSALAYASTGTAQNLTVTAPSRTGYTFKGWSFVSHKGAVSGTTTQIKTPVQQGGNLTAYAVWELNAFTGTVPSAATVTYGANGVFTAAGLTHPATTTNTSYGVNITYQWQNSAGTNISGATGSTYTLNKPNAGTYTYKVVVTATPKDGVSAAKSTTYTVTLTVKRKGVAVPTAKTGLVYNGNAQDGVVSANTNLYTVAGGTHTAANAYNEKYTATATLKDKTNYTWGADGASLTTDQSITWRIDKKAVAAPTMASASLVFNTKEQSPTITVDSTLTTYTANKGRNVGAYSTSVTLQDTTNYKWTGRSGAEESTAYVLNWNIVKADVTISKPTFKTTAYYVGQQLGAIELNQDGSHLRAGSTDVVEGTFSWNAPQTVMTAAMNQAVILFTPTGTDAGNYNTATVTVTIAPVQLYINVYEIALEFRNASGTAVDLADLERQLAAASGADKIAVLQAMRKITSIVKTVKSPVPVRVNYGANYRTADIVGVSAWQKPTGYNLAFYSGKDSQNNGTGALGDTLYNITSNQTVYLAYEAQETTYKVYNIFQRTDGSAATVEDIYTAVYAGGGNLPGGVAVTNGRANAGGKVSYGSTTFEGFTRKTSINGSDGVTYVSDDVSKLVLGNGETVVVTYFQRNTYTLTWSYSGGFNLNESEKKVNSNKKTVSYLYEQKLEALDFIPQYDGFEFDAWYFDSALTIPLDVNTFEQYNGKMPARNITIYAGRSSVEYTITYNYGLDFLLDSLQEYNVSELDLAMYFDPNTGIVSPKNPEDVGVDHYSLEQLINTGNIRPLSPTVRGFTFLGWYYNADDTEKDAGSFDEYNLKLTTISRTSLRNYHLVAKWAPATFSVSLNTNGGTRMDVTRVNVTNFGAYPEELLGYREEVQLKTTRSGYTFEYWYYMQDGREQQIEDGIAFNVLTCGTTLYAKWAANAISMNVTANGADHLAQTDGVTVITSSGERYSIDDVNNRNVELHINDTITIQIQAEHAYAVTNVVLAGRTTFVNGGKYTLSSYPDDTLTIEVTFAPIKYKISYEFGGGAIKEGITLPRDFTIESDGIDVYGGANISQLGYDFQGWNINSPESGRPLGNADVDRDTVSPDELAIDGVYGDVTLYAKWSPAKVTIRYHNNYIVNGSEIVVEESNDNSYTGNTDYELTFPDKSFVPTNRELVGWSITPNGSIAYSISYHYDKENEEFIPQPLKYTIRPDANNVNDLYAVWRIANQQYLIYESTGNGMTFTTDSANKGVTLTARPRFSYEKEAGLSLIFQWYKVDTSWEKWTEADKEGKTDEEKSLIDTKIGMYKIPANAVPLRTHEINGITEKADQQDSFTVYNASEAGLYTCSLLARGTRVTVDGVQTSTVEMLGEFEVIINKANIANSIEFKDAEVTYNNETQRMEVKVPSAWVRQGNTDIYKLPDSSDGLKKGDFLKVTYVYTDAQGNELTTSGALLAGTYTVTARFSFESEEKGGSSNYVVPDAKTATFTVNKERLEDDDIQYVIERYNPSEGVWEEVKDTEGHFVFQDNKYTGSAYRIVATSPRFAALNDGGNVSVVIYYDGDVATGENGDKDHASNPVNVGYYTAYCDGLDGERKDCYELSTEVRGRTFNIIKATHDVKFVWGEVSNGLTYALNDDGTAKEHVVSITGAFTDNGNTAISDYVTGASNTSTDTFTVDGSSIVATYSVSFNRNADTLSANAGVLPRGGVNAGEYTVTVTFADSNEDNYEPIPDEVKTFTVSQATYKLSDEELNRYVDGQENPEGFGENHVVYFDGQTGYYAPHLNIGGTDDTNFRVSYKYEYMGEKNGSTDPTKFIELPGLPADSQNGGRLGLHADGLYRITASVTNISPLYANNYATLADQVVELKILPGRIAKIVVNYNQNKWFTYGDVFDLDEESDLITVTIFYAKTGDEFTGKLVVDPNNFEEVDVASCLFFNEGGTAFTVFDRANAVNDGANWTTNSGFTPIDGTSGVYKIGVTFYDVKLSDTNDDTNEAYAGNIAGELHVVVRQALLNDDNVGFDGTNDEHLSNNGIIDGKKNYSYNLIYDGSKHLPALLDKDGVFNFVGIQDIDGLEIKKGEITAKYYIDDGGWREMTADELKGFADQGTRNIKVVFTNSNKNYADLKSSTELVCLSKIDRKTLSADDIIWQYTTTPEDANSWQKLENLRFNGKTFTVRAVYRDLAAQNGYIQVKTIKNGDQNGEAVNVTDADDYTITILSLGDETTEPKSVNYRLGDGGLNATLTILPCEVTLTWSIDGDSLTYNAADQMGKVKVTYTKAADDKDELVNITLSVDDAEKSTEIVNAGTYTIVANLNNSNYTALNGTYNVTIAPYKVTEAEVKEWQYKDGEQWTAMPDETAGVDYKGGNFEVQVIINGVGGDGEQSFIALDGNDNAPRNASNYLLSPGLQGDYDLTEIEHNFKVNKAKVTVTWDETHNGSLVYNGKEQKLQYAALGVGDESDVTVVELSGDAYVNARDNYVAQASVKSEFAANYEIVGANADGELDYEWAIAKRPIDVKWTVPELIYNSFVLKFDVTVDNLVLGDDGTPADEATLQYTVAFIDKDGNRTENAEIIGAGTYEVILTGVSNDNYVLRENDPNVKRQITVNRATPTIENVIYKEYADNVSYVGRTLRSEKLTYNCGVPGVMEFADKSPLAVGRFGYKWTFKPNDSVNYTDVTGNVNITVVQDEVDRLVLDKEGLVTFYTIHSTFTSAGAKVYLAYKSTYEENGVWYGAAREQLNRNQVSFRYNGGVAINYEFTESDIGEQTIIVLYDYNGIDISASYTINISRATPRAIIITNKEEVESAEYYVGQTFDVNTVKFEAEYSGMENAPIDASRFEVSDINLNDPGKKTISFTIATGDNSSITVEVTIEVREKITVEVSFPSRSYKWQGGEPIELVLTQKNGDKIPEGITYFFGDKNGNKITVTDKTVTPLEVYAYFTVVNKVKYNDIAPVKAQIEVKEILAAVDRNATNMPALDVTYNNTEFNYKLSNIVVTDGNGGVYNVLTDTVTYTINGYPEGNIAVKNAGVYEIVVSFKVTNEELGEIQIDERYTITVAPDKNEIYNFAIASWIEGQSQSEVVLNAKYGTADITYYTDADCTILYHDGKTRPNSVGVYYAVAVIAGCESYEEERATCRFSVNKATLESDSKDEEGKSEIIITTDNGMDPSYGLIIDVLTEEATAEISIKSKIILAGYSIDLVDEQGNRPVTEQSYTVRLKLTAEQLSQKKLAVYSVNSLGQTVDLNGKVTEDGYIEFTVNTFEDATSEDHAALRFVIGARDAAAARRTGLIIGVSVGALIAVAAITALIIIFVKKKKENDE